MDTSIIRGSASLNSSVRKKKIRVQGHKTDLNVSRRLNKVRGLNTSANHSLIQRNTLRANNKALAKALQHARQENRVLQASLMDRTVDNQNLLHRITHLHAVSGLKDEEIEGEVQRRMNIQKVDNQRILNKIIAQLLDTVQLLGVALDSNSERHSSIGSIQLQAETPVQTERKTSPPDTLRPSVFNQQFRPFDQISSILGLGNGVFPSSVASGTHVGDLSLIDEGCSSQTISCVSNMEITEEEEINDFAAKKSSEIDILKSRLPQRVLINSKTVTVEEASSVESSKRGLSKDIDQTKKVKESSKKSGETEKTAKRSKQKTTDQAVESQTEEPPSKEPSKRNKQKATDQADGIQTEEPPSKEPSKRSKQKTTDQADGIQNEEPPAKEPLKRSKQKTTDQADGIQTEEPLSKEPSKRTKQKTTDQADGIQNEEPPSKEPSKRSKQKTTDQAIESQTEEPPSKERSKRSKQKTTDQAFKSQTESDKAPKKPDFSASKSKPSHRRGTFDVLPDTSETESSEAFTKIQEKDCNGTPPTDKTRRGTYELPHKDDEVDVVSAKDVEDLSTCTANSKTQSRKRQTYFIPNPFKKSSQLCDEKTQQNADKDTVDGNGSESADGKTQTGNSENKKRKLTSNDCSLPKLSQGNKQRGTFTMGRLRKDSSSSDNSDTASTCISTREVAGKKPTENLPEVLTSESTHSIAGKNKRGNSRLDGKELDQTNPKRPQRRGTFTQKDAEVPTNLIEDEDDSILLDKSEDGSENASDNGMSTSASSETIDSLALPTEPEIIEDPPFPKPQTILEEPALPEPPKDVGFEFGGSNFMMEEDVTLYMNDDMEMTEVLKIPIVFNAQNLSIFNSQNLPVINAQNLPVLTEANSQNKETVPDVNENTSSAKSSSDRDTASSSEESSIVSKTKEKPSEAAAKSHVEVRVGKLGDVRYAAGRKDADGVRKVVPQKLPAKSRSKQKKTKPPPIKSAGKNLPVNEDGLKTGEPPSIFDYHDKTPVTKEKSAPAQKSIYDISMNESIANQKSSYNEFRKRITESMPQEEHLAESSVEVLDVPSKKTARSKRRTMVDVNYCDDSREDDVIERTVSAKPKTKSKQRRRSSRQVLKDASSSESENERKGSSNDRAAPSLQPINPKLVEKLRKRLPSILVNTQDDDSPIVRKRLLKAKRVTIAIIADDDESEHSEQESSPASIQVQVVQETPLLKTKRQKSRVNADFSHASNTQVVEADVHMENDKEEENAHLEVHIVDDAHVDSDEEKENSPSERVFKKPKEPKIQSKKRRTSTDLVEAYNQLNPFGDANKRKRRGGTQVCYTEPSIHSKLRQGDKGTTSVYGEGEHHMNGDGGKKSRSKSKGKPSGS